MTKRREPLKPPKPTPIRANRAGEMLRKVFNLAIAWKMRPDNPALGFRRRMEVERERFLSMDEIARLGDALTTAEDQRAAAREEPGRPGGRLERGEPRQRGRA